MIPYGEDLAHIHDTGFGDFARQAAAGLIDLLGGAGRSGEVLTDLGCGAGVWARRATDAGWRVLGIDLSPAMVALARERVPEAEFRVGSLFQAVLPRCSAVTAIGECLGYVSEAGDPSISLPGLLRRIHAALQPHGSLIFDLAGPGRGRRGEPQRIEASDWAIEVRTEEHLEQRLMVRHITTWRRLEGGRRRQGHEIHRLRLFSPDEVLASLEQAGFECRALDRYGSMELPAHLIGYLARKVDA